MKDERWNDGSWNQSFFRITVYTLPKSGRLSQRVMNENPRKRPRVPPKSATKEVTGYISCSVLMVVFFETAHSEKTNPSASRLTRSFPPTKWYFLYWHGFRQPVNAVMSSKSAVLKSSNSFARSLYWNTFADGIRVVHRVVERVIPSLSQGVWQSFKFSQNGVSPK